MEILNIACGRCVKMTDYKIKMYEKFALWLLIMGLILVKLGS